jgi:hypothetical protein
MKVYGLPEELKATLPVHDYRTTDYDAWTKAENEHRATIKAWLLENGYTGRHTGRILRMPVADSYAEYMVADGAPSMLLHLPYCDGYDSPDVQFLPKKEVLRRCTNHDKLFKLMGGG